MNRCRCNRVRLYPHICPCVRKLSDGDDDDDDNISNINT
jgi:hypothetical protein